MRQQFVCSEILGQLSQLADTQFQAHSQITLATSDLQLRIMGRLKKCPLNAKVWVEIPDTHPLLTQLVEQRLAA